MALSTQNSSLDVEPSPLPNTLQNLSHLVSVKLSKTNYLLWKNQILPILHSQDLLKYIDGSLSIPPQTISETISDQTSLVPNPKYLTWFRYDQAILSWLNSTLTESVFSQVVGLPTARSVWLALESSFSASSSQRALHLRFALQNIKKGVRTVSDYLQEVKNIADQLAAIQQPVADPDLVLYVLTGLDLTYEPLRMAIMVRQSPVTFQELQSLLTTQELHLSHTNQQETVTNSAFVATSSRGGQSRGRGRGGRGRGFDSGRGRNRHNNHFQQHTPQSGVLGPAPHPEVCQICGKRGHGALRCYKRFDQAYQADDVPSAFAAMNISSSDQQWYPDTGATHHMTANLEALASPRSYSGNDTICVGNGNHLPITHVGQTVLQTSDSSLPLNNVLIAKRGRSFTPV